MHPYTPTRIRQLVIDAYGCRGDLGDRSAIEGAFRRGCREVGAHIIRVTAHHYRPQGLTVFAFLRESHLLVTTWPELAFATVEIFLCSESMDPWPVWDALELCLDPTEFRTVRILHRIRECEARSPRGPGRRHPGRGSAAPATGRGNRR